MAKFTSIKDYRNQIDNCLRKQKCKIQMWIFFSDGFSQVKSSWKTVDVELNTGKTLYNIFFQICIFLKNSIPYVLLFNLIDFAKTVPHFSKRIYTYFKILFYIYVTCLNVYFFMARTLEICKFSEQIQHIFNLSQFVKKQFSILYTVKLSIKLI